MKHLIVLVLFLALLYTADAQTLSLDLKPASDPIELGNKAWYGLKITNDTDENLVLFRNMMQEYGVGGYEYTVLCNGKEILHKKTWGLDTNSKFKEQQIVQLAPGDSQGLLGLWKIKLEEPGEYEIRLTYFQDPSGLDGRYAKNGKAKKLAKTITSFKTEIVHKFDVE